MIVQHFDSAETIEITLLLRRSPGTFWSPAAVGQQLDVREDLADRKMRTLAAAKILVPAERSTAFRYAPASEELAGRVDTLADLYANRRISVINAIYSANLEKLRTFSDAFKLTQK